jgi:peptide chain release factor 1
MIDTEKLNGELAELNKFLARPDAYAQADFAAKTRRAAEISDLLGLNKKLVRFRQNLTDDQKLVEQKSELAELAAAEIPELEQKICSVQNQIDEKLVPHDPNDGKNAIVEIRAGAGGDEASLFAGDLLRMYLRYCENHRLKTEILSENMNEAGGYKEVILLIRGEQPYGQLKFEAGVHRVQRVPITESQGRIHTSTATVAVLPEATETDIVIDPKDLRIDIFHASGHGGQGVNTTSSAVRITHLPTGIIVTNQDERSQIKNKAKALSVLRAKLLQIKLDKEAENASAERKALIGTGDRSEKIRTYNFPQDRVTDHRIHYSRSNLPAVMDGDLDDIISGLRARERELNLANL